MKLKSVRQSTGTLRGLSVLTAAALMMSQVFAVSTAEAQTLPEALSQAYDSNPTLRAARAELRSVNENVPQELSNWRPNVTAGSSLGKRRSEVDSDGTDSEDSLTPFTANIDVTQPLYRGGRTIAGTERAENEVKAQRESLRSTEQSVLLSAATSYTDVWRDQAVLQLNISNEGVLAQQLEATEDRFEVGEVTRTDVAQAETRHATAVSDRIAAEGNLTSSRAVYQEVIGSFPGTLPAPPVPGDLPTAQDEIVAQATKNNPDVTSAVYTELAAQKNVRQVTGELYPEVSLVGSLSHQDEVSSSDTETDSASLIAQVSIPIYQQGSVSSRVRAAKQISSQRRVQIEEQRRRAEQVAVSAWEALMTAQAQIRSFESAVASAEIALEGVRQENEVGARTILDILDAEQELLNSQVSLVGAQRDEVVAGYQVLSAIGRLNAGFIGLPVEVYDVEADYRSVRDKWFGLSAPGTE
ncbi:TolC family outer membrane protein [Pelagibius sp. Alg239-R121]|uniref:TolC family outer membrane protein n=1 Tax=Pelagibius sp. Alg239-R121 TaxID=2993448 RepID=UPI0024A6C576|nr:TolC family outer membrane protein [Pelagibius sp. Alg239-R121]